MPEITDIASPLISGLSTGYKIYDSIRKNAQANKIERNNVRPTYNRPREVDDVYSLASSELGNNDAENFAAQALSQNESNGIDAILKSGGKADFGVIHNTYGNQLSGLLSQISKNRDQKIATYNNAAYNLGQAKDAEFMYNKDAPYKDQKQREAQLRGGAENSLNEAFGLAAGGISNYGIAKDKPGQYGKTVSQDAADMTRQIADPYAIGVAPATGASVGALPPINTQFDYSSLPLYDSELK